MSKYVFFTGGVVSGLGKGITAASLGALFKARGYSVAVLRFNPFFNIDSSNLSPRLHGEIYITEDGRSCDLVVGHYERIMGEDLHSYNDVTSGEIYSAVIAKERLRMFNGSTVQVVPHITDEIKSYVLSAGKINDSGVEKEADIVIVEVGGTVGDIETQPYLEAIRQLKSDLGKNNVAYVHVSLVNYIDVSGEQKTKPTQHSVRELQNLGIRPDVIVCRTDYPLEQSSRNKLSLFCNCEKDCIIENTLNENIYEIPIKLENEGFCKVVLRHLKMEDKTPDLSKLQALNDKINKSKNEKDVLKIGIMSRFISNLNAHISLRQALTLSAAHKGIGFEFVEISSPEIDMKSIERLDGLIITEGIDAENETDYSRECALINYAKKNDLPLLLIDKACFLTLLPQGVGPLAACACIKEQIKINTVAISRLESSEKPSYKSPVYVSSFLKVAESPVSVISNTDTVSAKKSECKNCWITGERYRPDSKLGARKTVFVEGTMLYNLYGKEGMERHNKDLCADRSLFDKAGYLVSGINDENLTVDAFELKGHRFFVGVMFHPEFSVKSDKPHKLIDKFLTESFNKKIGK